MAERRKIIIKLLALFAAAVIVIGVSAALIILSSIRGKSDSFKPYEMGKGTEALYYVAMDHTQWKYNTIKEVSDALMGQATLTIAPLKSLKTVKTADWDKVIIMAPHYLGKLQRDARRFIDKAEDTGKILLVVTTFEEDESPVETISSATRYLDDMNPAERVNPIRDESETASEILSALNN